MWRRMVRGLVLGSALAFLLPSAFAQDFVGVLENPLEGETVSGMVLVRGYAFDDTNISKIEVYVDDALLHEANINLPRIDVVEAYPNWEGIHLKNPGFQTGFLASRFTDGAHTVHVLVTTSDGQEHMVGRRVINVNNTINQPPFGSVDIPDRRTVNDASGSYPVVGWATDADGVKQVDILVDGLVHQSAVYGDPRPDVGNAFPDLPAAAFSGFIAHIDTTRLADGIHQLAVQVEDRNGLRRTIGQRTVQVFNSESLLQPFGSLDEPLKDATLYGTNCDVVPPCRVSPCPPIDFENHLTPVRGWALDLGTRTNTGRVAYAELLVDGAKWLSTDQCTFNATLGAFVNCYGLDRPDVARYFPTYPDSPRSGFLFTLDVGYLMALGVPPGHHWLQVRVGDEEQTFAELPGPAGVNVFFTCVEQSFDFPSFGYIEFPDKMDFVNGVIRVRGWAMDENLGGVAAVNIFVDGQFMGIATYGLERPDVIAAYPTVRFSPRPGWIFDLDTRQLSDARHRLTVEAIDGSGRKAIIGSVDFYVDNP